LVALCATHVGVAQKALEITSAYVSERIQFGVPIGTFQAVQHRAADGYVDVEAMRWVTWRAAWKLSRGLPAERETMVAKFWCAEGGSRVVNSAQHLHGGIGVDLDYPVHRYFLWSKALEISLGSAAPQLARLGRDMARTGPQELS
jgi:alkylation response protein AidB-like acyl-CoA dehydrogenase